MSTLIDKYKVLLLVISRLKKIKNPNGLIEKERRMKDNFGLLMKLSTYLLDYFIKILKNSIFF